MDGTDGRWSPARIWRLRPLSMPIKVLNITTSDAQVLNIKGPVGVVSVCGRVGQGKSFMLNQVVGTKVFEMVLLMVHGEAEVKILNFPLRKRK